MSKFSKKTGTKKANPYAGIKPNNRGRTFPYGEHVVEYVGSEDSPQGGFTILKFKMIDGENVKIGAEYAVVLSTTGKASYHSASKVLGMCMALAGTNDFDEYLELDPDRDLVNYVLEGEESEVSETYNLEGRYLRVEAERGAPVKVKKKEGDEPEDEEGPKAQEYYTDITFSPIEEQDQEIPFKRETAE